MFYVVSDRYSTEHIGWELNAEIHTFMIFFCKSCPQERKNYPWLSFLINIQSEMKFLWSDLSLYASITKNIEDPIIIWFMNQKWISVNFWPQKWRFWYKSSPSIKCTSQYIHTCMAFKYQLKIWWSFIDFDSILQRKNSWLSTPKIQRPTSAYIILMWSDTTFHNSAGDRWQSITLPADMLHKCKID